VLTERGLAALLAFLVLFDATLTVWAGLFPDLWFAAFHGVPYSDPEGFLRRCAANWAAFAIFQGVALVRFRREPQWLAVVAGMRLGDCLTDWTYLAFSTHATLFGKLALASTSPLNVILGVSLLRAYRRRLAPCRDGA
jgi:hypothetical protein